VVVDLVLIVSGYLVGSISFAVIICRVMGLPDPRQGGSGNPGATNVLRLGSKRAAAVTLGADVLKGLLPVLAASALQATPAVLTAVAGAAFLGHVFPVFFGFRGGKGVATALGALLGIDWRLGGLLVITWLVVATTTRFSSLAALTATLLAPLFALFLFADRGPVAGIVLISVLLFWRHRENIRRLLDGTETKIGARSTSPPSKPD